MTTRAPSSDPAAPAPVSGGAAPARLGGEASRATSAAEAARTPLRAEALLLRRGGRRVVDDVSLSLRAGEWTAVVGPNGAGKSSLLSLLAGLLTPESGRVWLEDRPLTAWPPRERAMRLAWLAQQGEAVGDLAARDVVALGRLPHQGLFGSPGAQDLAAVASAMQETESSAFAGRRLGELSGGERQRVLLARALAVQPRVMLLDEPTTHLDAPHQRALARSVRERAAAGVAVVTVMHDLTLALAADRVLVMDGGRLRADGPASDPALRTRLVAVFGGAFTLEQIASARGGPRWVAVPLL